MLEHVNYVYIKDGMGEVIASIQKSMPVDENSVFIKLIAERRQSDKQRWSKRNKDQELAIELKRCDIFQLYVDPEKFFEEFMDAIL